MKFATVLLGFAAFFLPTEALEKTQEEAHKFLIDGGYVSAESDVQTFQVDREGNLRLQLDDGGKSVSYGLGTEQ